MPHWDRFANRNTLWASLFLEELARGGVTSVCISPGSRSTPLALAAAHTPGLEIHLVLDERSAGFFALGQAKASGRPVALICTSGTAAVNLHPAVVEAHMSATPLVILTADRPPVLRDVGEGQTIDQLNLYGSAVRWFHEVGEPVMEAKDLRNLRTLAARALSAASLAPAGPVHLNFPFRKPLEAQQIPGDIPPALRTVVEESDAPELPYGQLHPSPGIPPQETIRLLASRIRAAPRGLILCGPINTPLGSSSSESAGKNSWPEALTRLAERCGYPILAEPPSGLMGGPHDRSHVIPHTEAILRHEKFRRGSAPELILRFGAMPTPRQIEVLLDEHPNCPVVVVDPGGRWRDPTHHPGSLVVADPTLFCNALAESLGGLPPDGEDRERAAWLARFQTAGRLAGEAIAEAFSAPLPEGLGDAWFEGRVLAELEGLLPDGALLCTASSMPVRDLAYFFPLGAKRIHHQVNRGANGIDGTLSAALGATAAARALGPGEEATQAPTVLVTGDLAFLHDANGLHIARQYGLPLTIVLINNNGGGIFEMLPIAEYGETYETYFGTPHGIDFAAFCAGYGISHRLPADWTEFRETVRGAIASPEPMVIEVRTDRVQNRLQHGAIWSAVAARLEGPDF